MIRIAITFLSIFIASSSLMGQISLRTLFVNDNSVFSYNTDTVINALNASGLAYDVFDARDSLRSPTIEEMEDYDLIIWYCSTDGVGNYLWNGDDSDNTDLMVYMENGGYLWVMGTDFLYDRYVAPYTFSEGDFLYDYLGTWEYHAQSYGDDGGTGVSELNLAAPSFSSLNTIYWVFPTAWWVDACVPLPEATSIYEMGPDGYPLNGYSSAIGYSSGSHMTITFFFDPALISSFQDRLLLFKDILNYITLFSDQAEILTVRNDLAITPNPVNKSFQISIPEVENANDLKFLITSLRGEPVSYRTIESSANNSLLELDHPTPGFYLIKTIARGKVYTGKFIVN